MTIRTCLLITDDPDDHFAMSEALATVSERTVLLNIIDSQKAMLLLREGSYKPDFVMVDLSMHGIKVNSILNVIRRNNDHKKRPVLVYGHEDDLIHIENRDELLFFDKEYDYSELRNFLKSIFG